MAECQRALSQKEDDLAQEIELVLRTRDINLKLVAESLQLKRQLAGFERLCWYRYRGPATGITFSDGRYSWLEILD